MEENNVKMHCNTKGKPCPLKDSDGVCTLLDDYCKKDEEELKEKVINGLYKLGDKLSKRSIILEDDEEWAVWEAINILEGYKDSDYLDELEYAAWEANLNMFPFECDSDR